MLELVSILATAEIKPEKQSKIGNIGLRCASTYSFMGQTYVTLGTSGVRERITWFVLGLLANSESCSSEK